jgi:hypothetical protein
LDVPVNVAVYDDAVIAVNGSGLTRRRGRPNGAHSQARFFV